MPSTSTVALVALAFGGVGVAWCESVSTREAPRLAHSLLTKVALYLYRLTTIASGLRLQ